jgi:nicotinamide riboside transporter PnuC
LNISAVRRGFEANGLGGIYCCCGRYLKRVVFKKENIWVYPTGLINTIFYIYLSFKGGLFGEASVNFYYTVMSIYGWVLWSRKDAAPAACFTHHIQYKKRMAATTVLLPDFLCGNILCITIFKKEFRTGCYSMGRCICQVLRLTQVCG